jgi:hypothetical protein
MLAQQARGASHSQLQFQTCYLGVIQDDDTDMYCNDSLARETLCNFGEQPRCAVMIKNIQRLRCESE